MAGRLQCRTNPSTGFVLIWVSLHSPHMAPSHQASFPRCIPVSPSIMSPKLPLQDMSAVPGPRLQISFPKTRCGVWWEVGVLALSVCFQELLDAVSGQALCWENHSGSS